jgi:hypothetical protein
VPSQSGATSLLSRSEASGIRGNRAIAVIASPARGKWRQTEDQLPRFGGNLSLQCRVARVPNIGRPLSSAAGSPRYQPTAAMARQSASWAAKVSGQVSCPADACTDAQGSAGQNSSIACRPDAQTGWAYVIIMQYRAVVGSSPISSSAVPFPSVTRMITRFMAARSFGIRTILSA